MTRRARLAGIMAAGSGSRLVGQGQTKALAWVAGQPLISYVLGELERAEIDHVHVVARADDEPLKEWLVAEGARSRLEIEIEPMASQGPVDSFLAINRALGGEPHVVTSCDVVLERGTIRRMLSEGVQTEPAPDMVLAVSTHVDDDRPIWVDVSPGGAVRKYGKQLEPTGSVFGNVRLVFPPVRAALAKVDASGYGHLTDLTAALVNECRVVAFEAGRVVDVDRDRDAITVERWWWTGHG